MITARPTEIKWDQLTHDLGKQFAKRAARHDEEGDFVYENYSELKAHQFFSATIPQALGGGGISHEQMCQIIRIMAGYCGSTALAFAMHQHLVGVAVWKYKTKGVGTETLKNIANQQLVLVSTGARDWLQSNGVVRKTNGGYLVWAKKAFASQSVVGDVAITSAPYQNEAGNWKVLHFPVPLDTAGVSLLDDWDVMGMRATGSQTIVFDEVFVPEAAIALERPREGFHMVWNVVLTVAMPLIMSAYVGIAERAAKLAISIGKEYPRNQDHLPYIIGKMNNSLLSAKAQLKAMHQLTNNLDFKPTQATTSDVLSYKTNVADAAIATVRQAMDAVGGQSFYRKNELERLFRDIQGGQFHPLPKWEQHAFSGRCILEL